MRTIKLRIHPFIGTVGTTHPFNQPSLTHPLGHGYWATFSPFTNTYKHIQKVDLINCVHISFFSKNPFQKKCSNQCLESEASVKSVTSKQFLSIHIQWEEGVQNGRTSIFKTHSELRNFRRMGKNVSPTKTFPFLEESSFQWIYGMTWDKKEDDSDTNNGGKSNGNYCVLTEIRKRMELIILLMEESNKRKGKNEMKRRKSLQIFDSISFLTFSVFSVFHISFHFLPFPSLFLESFRFQRTFCGWHFLSFYLVNS